MVVVFGPLIRLGSGRSGPPTAAQEAPPGQGSGDGEDARRTPVDGVDIEDGAGPGHISEKEESPRRLEVAREVTPRLVGSRDATELPKTSRSRHPVWTTGRLSVPNRCPGKGPEGCGTSLTTGSFPSSRPPSGLTHVDVSPLSGQWSAKSVGEGEDSRTGTVTPDLRPDHWRA